MIILGMALATSGVGILLGGAASMQKVGAGRGGGDSGNAPGPAQAPAHIHGVQQLLEASEQLLLASAPCPSPRSLQAIRLPVLRQAPLALHLPRPFLQAPPPRCAPLTPTNTHPTTQACGDTALDSTIASFGGGSVGYLAPVECSHLFQYTWWGLLLTRALAD